MRSFHDPNTVSAIFQFLVTHELCILAGHVTPLVLNSLIWVVRILN